MEQSIGELLQRFFGATSQFGSLDRTQTLPISLREAAEGCRKRVDVPRRVHCAACSATGEAGAGTVTRCNACSGRGRVTMHAQGRTLSSTCEQCNGRGEVVSRRCGDCGGSGRQLVREKLDVTVPPGVKHAQTLLLRGKGDQGALGDDRCGDLLLSLQVREHDVLRREDDDIYVDVSIDAEVAERGGTVQVPGLHGCERVQVPPGAKDGDEIRVAGHGALRFGSPPRPPPMGDAEDGSPYRGAEDIAGDHRGDLVVRLYVEVRSPSKATRVVVAAALVAAAATALALLL